MGNSILCKIYRKNCLSPALEGFDKKIGSYKNVFDAFIHAGDEVRNDLFKMFEKNKELRQRLAQKEQKLQEYMSKIQKKIFKF